jgi:UDP-glucose-4-epimerase GalE
VTILVTGSAGFIGSHICFALEAAGLSYHGIDNFCSGEKVVNLDRFSQIDIADSLAVAEVIREKNIKTVIHLAAFSQVQESIESPEKYFQNNIESTSSFIRVCLKCSVRDFIFSSSCSVYGDLNNDPLNEAQIRKPITPYGYSKMVIEDLLEYAYRLRGMNSICFRYFNAAGANTNAGLRENHMPETHFIPLAVDCALQGKVLNIFGSNLHTKDGTPVRDFVHVEDIAEAHISAMNQFHQRSGHYRVNIGSGVGCTLLEIVNEITRQGLKVDYCFKPPRFGDPTELVADISRAKSLLDWSPRSSSLENIVGSTINSRI